MLYDCLTQSYDVDYTTNALNDERQRELEQQHQAATAATIQTLRDARDNIPTWLAQTDPTQVKLQLSRVVRIVAHPDKTIKLEAI